MAVVLAAKGIIDNVVKGHESKEIIEITYGINISQNGESTYHI